MRRVMLAVALAGAACSDRSRSSPPSSAATGSDAMFDDGAATPRLSVEAAVALFEAVAACRLEPHGLDHMCPERNALDQAYSVDVDPHRERYDLVQEAARKVITHASPAVRARAFDELWTDADEPLLMRAIRSEPDPMALRAMITVSATNTEFDPEMVDAVLSHIAHPVPEVRLAVMQSLAVEYNVTHPGLFEAIALRITSDPDPAVRADACFRLGLLQDPRSVAIHDRLLVAATPPALFDACAIGLMASWLGDPKDEHPVEAAYHRTLTLLAKGPHRRGAPGKLTVDGIRGLAHALTFDALPSWVDMPAARAAVAAFIASPRADPDARRGAAELFGELDPTLDELRTFRARIRDRGALGDELREYLENAESFVDEPPP